MGKYSGRDIKIGIAKEGTRGSPIASTYWVPRRTFDLDDKAVVITDDQTYGVIEDSVDEKVVNRYAEGTLGGIVRSRAIGLFLLNALGYGTPTAVGSPVAGMYTHTFTVAQDHQHDSLCMEVEDPIDGDLAYGLVMLKSLEISAELNEFVMFTADMIAKAGTPVTATAAYVAEDNFTAKNVTLNVADTNNQLATPTTIEIKSATLTIEKEIEKDDVLGKEDPDDFLNKTIRITLTVSRTYEDDRFKDCYVSASPMAASLVISAPMAGSSGSPTSITAVMNQVKVTDWSTSKDLDGIITESVTLKSNFKIADSKMVEIRLANTVETYW